MKKVRMSTRYRKHKYQTETRELKNMVSKLKNSKKDSKTN